MALRQRVARGMAKPAVGLRPGFADGSLEPPLEHVVDADVVELRAAFPDVDVLAECKKARAWCVATRAKRKTPGGMPKFLFGWLERSQNSGRSRPSNAGDDPRGNVAALHAYLARHEENGNG